MAQTATANSAVSAKRSRPSLNTLDIIGATVVLAAHLVGGFMFALEHLSNPNIWFDESGQYWLSRGLSHDSAIDATPQWIGAGVLNGMTGFNLDPPGFTVGLAAIIQILGSTPAALRLLPFTAFLATILVFYLLGRKALGLPRTLAVALPALPLTTALPLFFATEIRAYSGELLAVSLALLTTPLIIHSQSVRGALPFISSILFGMFATRYFFAVAAAAMGIVYVSSLIPHQRWRQRRGQLVAVAFGYATAAVGTAWNIGLFGPGSQIGYGRGYAQSGVSLATTDDPFGLALGNFTTGEQWLVGLFLIVGAVVSVMTVTRTYLLKRIGAFRPRSGVSMPWLSLWLLVLVYEILAACLSYFGNVPWDISNRWSIGLWSVAAASILGLARIAQQAIEFVPPNPRTWLAIALVAAITIPTVSTTTSRLIAYERPNFRVLGSQLPGLITETIDPNLKTQWVVDYWTWPGFRWLAMESGLWPKQVDFTTALPVGDGVLTNANWPDVVPNLRLCPPGWQTVVLQERWNDNYEKREIYVTNWGLQQRCGVEVTDIGKSEMLVRLFPR